MDHLSLKPWSPRPCVHHVFSLGAGCQAPLKSQIRQRWARRLSIILTPEEKATLPIYPIPLFCSSIRLEPPAVSLVIQCRGFSLPR